MAQPSHELKQSDKAVVLIPTEPARNVVIWLHGLGADGNDFVPIVPELGVDHLAVKFIFPHAPVRPVTINMGMKMRAWYDILSLGDPSKQDQAGIRESARILRGYIEQETAAGIPSRRILVAGFSQGGAIALHAGLRNPEPLAGILALSTYLPLFEQFGSEASGERKDTPVFMCHGEQDAMLPMQLGEMSRDLLLEEGYSVQWHQYPMAHQVCVEEIAAIGTWMREVLGDAG